MKRVVITGATGVVGTALTAEMLKQGIEVLALLREGSPNNSRLKPHQLLTIRECSVEHLQSFVNDTGRSWDAFYHLGWTGTKGQPRFDPRIHSKNVSYAVDAVDLAFRLGCSVFIGAGSQAEYGRCSEKLTPYTPARPENAYGIGKLCAGFMTREQAHKLGMRHIWTRILSVYGPCDGEKTLVTYFINSFRQHIRPSCTEGTQIWDLLYSGDAARALRMIGENGRDGKTYLIASGAERMLRFYIEEMRDVLAPGTEIGFGEVPYGENAVMYLAADISETIKDTGWRPEVSFAEGIRRTAEELRCMPQKA